MEIKIQLDGVTVRDEAKVLTGVTFKGNGKCDIQARNTEVSGNAQLLTDMEIEEVMERAETVLKDLDPSSVEYASLSQVIQVGRKGSRKELLKKIGMHIGSFTEGVLQNIISDVISGRR